MKHILAIRTDHLGDLLLSTPLLRNVKTAWPQSSITLIASPANAAALAAWPVINNVIVYDPDASWQEKLRFISELRKTRWDLCLTLAPRTLAYILGWLSNATIRVGIIYSRRILTRLLAKVFLTHPVIMDIDESLRDAKPIQHEVKQLAQLAIVLGIAASPGKLELPLTSEDQKWAQDFWDSHQASTRKIIAIHCANKWRSEEWTAENLWTLITALCNDHPNKSLLISFGPGERKLADEIGEFRNSTLLPNLIMVRDLPLGRWASLLHLSTVIVSPDTGSLHLGVALEKPVVAVYDNSSFDHCSQQWGPWQVPHVSIRKQRPDFTISQIIEGVRSLETTT